MLGCIKACHHAHCTAQDVITQHLVIAGASVPGMRPNSASPADASHGTSNSQLPASAWAAMRLATIDALSPSMQQKYLHSTAAMARAQNAPVAVDALRLAVASAMMQRQDEVAKHNVSTTAVPAHDAVEILSPSQCLITEGK